MSLTCFGGSALCCVCTGTLLRWRASNRPTRQAQRYMLAPDEEDEEDELLQSDMAGDLPSDAFARGLAALPSGPAEGDLIGGEHTAATPATGGVTRESWVADLDAELAEFDALTASEAPQSGDGAALMAELGDRLLAPAPSTPAAREASTPVSDVPSF
ncbi:hypothetical protein EMIHUDRAFT_450724 [Emiliania huxleyi CCMP1516]|uniref:Uncharacterized protein n=2 Tax=Emiliania huxleyi TaxID=2903 RepID=A0A0D3IR17_EMIH1|nr:hypothetical protein EMIHUDRAFT_459502 [Emiliania huxleyi CCMP1516]XP_005774654.1 hypothetical protein EMIHUDRAFT_450724 [Emiliania huxleyi CCMP1516]EOD13702.1 hypothetical protein EMIHUDRAFT_459502 [Emiliania huxleyi CCMP1516]EOD22225.1 hypothetical protein EMIHUDRAFT_450724 [Emiliania huxleyi CCMP1516]|eukprot:XP_005766131.1 hypothetical protein EMIHUDRAFT_459502 [Emiliania huxleyi CCMP1516]